MNDLVKSDVQEFSILAVIERAARDPQVDIEKMRQLLAMRNEEDAKQAKRKFDEAMAVMQPELPVIKERGKAIVQGQVRYTYALWEDVNDQIKPILSKYGFAMTFRTDFSNGICITGVLSHDAGHREETSILLPADATGSKSPVQAVASTISYGKRYTAGLLLNLTTHGEDDDAYSSSNHHDNHPGRPIDGVFEQAEAIGWPRNKLQDIAIVALEYRDVEDIKGAFEFLDSQGLPAEAKAALWTFFDSKFRSALKKQSKNG
jgi:hypothetical protein